MLDKFYYENSYGERINFGSDGVYANYNDLRDYTWEPTSSGEFSRPASVSKELPIVFYNLKGKDTRTKRNEVFAIFEKDVKTKKPGRFYINGYYLECYVVATVNEKYLKSHYGRMIVTNFTVYTEEPAWKKETTFQFMPKERVEADDGIDFDFDFSFDLGLSKDDSNNTIENEAIVNSEFVMTIFGSCTDPDVEINGHHYKILGSIASNERIVITSSKPKNRRGIKKYNNDDGTTEDWFGHRWKEQSVFEPIPSGVSSVNYDGTFGFEIILIDERSEPPWEYEERETSNPESGSSDGREYEYLLDWNGNNILDSGGDYVEAGVI